MVARTFPNLELKAGYDIGEDGWGDDMSLNMLKLSILSQGTVIDKVAVEPMAPVAGDVYLLDETNMTNPNAVAVFDGEVGFEVWVYIEPKEGWLTYNQTAGYYEKFDGSVWAELATGGSGGGGGSGPSYIPIAGCNFDATGPTIKNQFGGTLTKTGTGRFTFTFTSPLASDEYFVTGISGRNISGEPTGTSSIILGIIEKTTDYVKINSVYQNGSMYDGEETQILIFPKEITPLAPIGVATEAGNYTVTGTESYVIFDDATAQIVELPSSVTNGFQVSGHRGGVGTVTFAPGAGATVVSADSFLDLRVQYSAFTATKISATEWSLAGDLA